eukprot:3411706-Amphidinium_carterae.1
MSQSMGLVLRKYCQCAQPHGTTILHRRNERYLHDTVQNRIKQPEAKQLGQGSSLCVWPGKGSDKFDAIEPRSEKDLTSTTCTNMPPHLKILAAPTSCFECTTNTNMPGCISHRHLHVFELAANLLAHTHTLSHTARAFDKVQLGSVLVTTGKAVTTMGTVAVSFAAIFE